MEEIDCSETSANINQAPGKHPKENTLNTEHGESLKSITFILATFPSISLVSDLILSQFWTKNSVHL
jgi:hypothetical protein